MDEVMAAESDGIKAVTQEEMNAEIAAERETETASPPVEVKEVPVQKPEEEAKVPAKAEAKAPAKKKEESKAPKESSVAASSIRVHVDVLEDLMTQVSELVLTRNQLLQMVRGDRKSVV